MDIYPHVPYFYIIQHIPSGKFYAGSKWQKGCHPYNFMIDGGYTTSSDCVNDLIIKDGLSAFKTMLILTEDECLMSVLDYETIFLQTWDISNNENWTNKHNNIRYTEASYGSMEFKAKMKNKYGYEHAMEVPEIKERMIKTNLATIGVENQFQSEEVKEKTKAFNLLKYGVEFFCQTEEFAEKFKVTNLERRGHEYPMQCELVKAKAKETCLANHGTEYPLLAPHILEKAKATNLAKYGVSNYMMVPANIEANNQKFFQKNGVYNPFQLESVKEKTRNTNLEKLGVDHHTKSPEGRAAIGARTIGSKFYTDGIKNYRIPPDAIPQSHWTKGLKKKIKEENAIPTSTSSVEMHHPQTPSQVS